MKWLSGEDGMKVRGWDFQLHQVLAKSLQTSNAWFPPPSFERRTIYCLKHQVVSEWSHLRIILSSHFHCIDETFAQNRQISKVAGRVDWEGWHPIKDYNSRIKPIDQSTIYNPSLIFQGIQVWHFVAGAESSSVRATTGLEAGCALP